MDESERGCDIAVRPRGKLKSGGDSHEQLTIKVAETFTGVHGCLGLGLGIYRRRQSIYVSISATRAGLFLWLLYREGSFQIGFYFDYSGGLFTSHRYVFLLAANRVELDQVTMGLANDSITSRQTHRRWVASNMGQNLEATASN
jgi:hypothetical protein